MLNTIIDDRAAARASFERLRGLPARMVYTGHGEPFPAEMLRRQ